MKDTIIDKENALLFQRLSSLKQFDEDKFARTREDAIDYANGNFTNFEGIEYYLDPTEYKVVGSAFKNDIRQSDEMKLILRKLDSGEYKRPLHLFLASLGEGQGLGGCQGVSLMTRSPSL